MKTKFILLISCLLLILSSCRSSSQVSCKMKPLKHKKYSTKRNNKSSSRKSSRSVGSKTKTIKSSPGRNSNEKVEKPIIKKNFPAPDAEDKNQLEKKELPIIEEVIVEKEEGTSIPDSKVDTLPEESKASLDNIAKDLEEDDEYTFDEEIEFINKSDLFTDRDESIEKISELAAVLKKDKDLSVTIIGHTATNAPSGIIIYGDDLAVYSQPAVLNNNKVTIYDVMIARANRVKDLLISKGVDENQIKRKAGSHRKYAKDRVVSFVLKRNEK